MFGKLSSGLKSAGVELPKEVQQLGSAAESLEKGGFNAETVTDSLKDVLETKTEADPETKKELNGKLDKLTGFLKSGSLSPTLIATLVPLGQGMYYSLNIKSQRIWTTKIFRIDPRAD